jgi:primosomal protein N' (replication factor Y)
MCHLCGYIEATPQNCRDCGSTKLAHGGAGTEKVEVALSRALEGIRVLRLDRDASRGKRLLDTLSAFRRHEADVLVGTQMLSKGHDFPGVTLVGILQADHGLGLPDLRASERTFQLLTQVAGRAGRGERPGRVLVQAYAVEHPAIRYASKHDFEGFAAQELEDRARMGNPPRGYLALLRVMGLDEGRVQARAELLARFLRTGVEKLRSGQEDLLAIPAATLLGPVPSPIKKINRRVRYQMLLRAPQRGALRWLLGHLRPHLGMSGSGAAQTMAIADVDPQTVL